MSAAMTSKTAVLRCGGVRGAGTRVAAKPFFSGTRLHIAATISSSKGSRKVTVMGGDYDNISYAYAKALVELAQGSNSLEEVHADVDGLSNLLKESDAVRDFLFNPVISEEKKKSTIADLAKEAGFNQGTVNFLYLLIDAQRIDALDGVIESFETEYCKLTDTQVATLRSAVKLEQEQQFLIAKKLQELTGSKNIKLKPVIDEALIAGFVVEYGSSQIDLSVKGQLDKITAELEASNALV